LSGTTRVSWYQKGKTNLDFSEARDSEWQWHQLGHMQVCTSLETDNHTSTPPLKFFTGQMPFLPPTNSVEALKAEVKKNIHRNGQNHLSNAYSNSNIQNCFRNNKLNVLH